MDAIQNTNGDWSLDFGRPQVVLTSEEVDTLVDLYCSGAADSEIAKFLGIPSRADAMPRMMNQMLKIITGLPIEIGPKHAP